MLESQPLDNELRLARIYNSGVVQVWEAWTDSDQVAEWWGPRGFSITTERKDVRAGGEWLYTMHGPDGVDYPNHTRYHEVVPFKKMIYDHGGYKDQPPLFTVTVCFSEIDDQTQMDMTFKFESATKAREVSQFIKQAGGETTWDRLGEFLEKRKSGRDIFLINRSFDRDQNSIFDLWTNPDHVMKWTPPTGTTGRYLKADIQPGGESHYEMIGNGFKLYGKAKYLVIERPQKIVYTQVFVDSEGNLARHPMAPVWPEEMKTTVRFFREGLHRTRVSVEWEISGKHTAEELKVFIQARPGMSQGWTGSFDKLDAYHP